QGLMARVGLGPPHDGVDGAPQLPVAAPALFRADEVLEGEFVWIEAVPDSSGASEVRDARFGAHARAREHHHSPGDEHPFCYLSDQVFHERRLLFFFSNLAGFLCLLALSLEARAGRGLRRVAAVSSLREPTPPLIFGPLAMALIHSSSSAASSR